MPYLKPAGQLPSWQAWRTSAVPSWVRKTTINWQPSTTPSAMAAERRLEIAEVLVLRRTVMVPVSSDSSNTVLMVRDAGPGAM